MPVRLVLLPGMDGTGDLFEPLRHALGPQAPVDVVRYPTQQMLGYDALMPLVRAQLPEQEPFVLLGESFSGPLAVSIASSPPVGLRALILCCSFARTPVPSMALLPGGILDFWARLALSKAMRAPMERMLLGSSPAPQLAALLQASLAKVSASVIAHRMKEVRDVNVLDRVSELRMPVMYLQAQQDRLVPRAAAADILRRLPSTHVVKLDGPHCLLQASPDASARAIVRFCRDLMPAAP